MANNKHLPEVCVLLIQSIEFKAIPLEALVRHSRHTHPHKKGSPKKRDLQKTVSAVLAIET